MTADLINIQCNKSVVQNTKCARCFLGADGPLKETGYSVAKFGQRIDITFGVMWLFNISNKKQNKANLQVFVPNRFFIFCTQNEL